MSEDAHRMFNVKPIEVAELILEKNRELTSERNKLKQASIDKAQAQSDYSKARLLFYLKVKNGVITEFEGQKIGAEIKSNLKFIAEGLSWKEEMEKDATEGLYKAITANMTAIQAELSGLQSINRYLDNLSK